jgi:hypothetical protein
MKNFYHKVAIASVFTALSFIVGTSEEVKAATITLPPTIQFGVSRNSAGSIEVTSEYDRVSFAPFGSSSRGVSRARLAEFNISSFFITPNTIIKSAVFQDKFSRVLFSRYPDSMFLHISSYIGNGTAEVSDADNGVFLRSVNISSSSPGDTFNVDVTTFVNELVSNGNPFAGFAIGTMSFSTVSLGGTDALGRSSLVIETVDAAEPVPEPTIIFGSALALSLGGWLKRKKLSPQSKTASKG